MSPIPTTLPLPPHFDPARAASWSYRPDEAALAASAAAWRTAHAIKPAAADELRVHLLLIDVQKDFCFPEGSLYVGGRSGQGAVEDSARIAELLYRNLGRITNVTTTHITFPDGYGIIVDKGVPIYVHLDVINESLIDMKVDQDAWLYYVPVK